MTLAFAAIAPHGGMVVDESDPAGAETREGMTCLAERFERAAPEAVLVLTPHGVHVQGAFAVVVAGEVAGSLDEPPVELSVPVDRGLAKAVVAALRRRGIPVAAVSFGGNDPDEAVMPMDWGTLIPLWHLGGRGDPPLPVVVVSPARDRPLEEHVDAGRALGEAVRAAPSRVALVASADHGHAHDRDGPYGFHPAAAEYDERVVELVRSNGLEGLRELASIVDAAKADSLWQLLMLHGALGEGWRSELLSYEAPTYFGMLCAAFEPA